MNSWIFITANHVLDNGEIIESRTIFETRMRDKFWGLGSRTRNRLEVRRGDRVVFYVGSAPFMHFAGTATLESDSFTVSIEQNKVWGHSRRFYESEYGVTLENIAIWRNPIPARDLIHRLQFIANKSRWGIYFQGGVRRIEESDYKAIVGTAAG